MDVSISDEIKETTGLITSAGSWGLNEFLVFLFIVFIGIILFVFFWAQRSSSKMTDAIIKINSDNYTATNESAAAIREMARAITQNHTENGKKLDEIHADVKEIKFNVKRKNKNFGEHIKESEYEDGIY